MPNCFQLIAKSDGQAAAFQAIDVDICKLLDVDVHPVRYAFGWYDAIGFRVACGKSFDDIRKEFTEYTCDADADPQYYETLLRILDYLEQHYTTSAWAEIGKR